MGITSFTLIGLGVDAAYCGVEGTVPCPRNGVKRHFSCFRGRLASRLGRRDNEFLPDKKLVAVRERVFFEDCGLRYAETGGDA
jgi:hypothetical protein